MAIFFYLFLKRFCAERPVDETMQIHKAQLFRVVAEHLLNETVLVVSINFACQLLPKQFQLSVGERVADGFSFNLVEAYFATDKLNPAFEFFFIVRELVNILAADFQFRYSLLAPVLLEIPNQDVNHLQTTEVKFCSFVVKHVVEDDLAGLVQNHEDVVEAVVVLIEPSLFVQVIQLLESDFLHQKEDVVGAEFVVAFLLDGTARLSGFYCVQTSRWFLSAQQSMFVIVLITKFPTAGCGFVLIGRLWFYCVVDS